MAKAKTTESANIFSTAATVKVEPKKAAADNKTKIEIKGTRRLRDRRFT